MSCGFIYAAANNKGMMLDNKKRQNQKGFDYEFVGIRCNYCVLTQHGI